MSIPNLMMPSLRDSQVWYSFCEFWAYLFSNRVWSADVVNRPRLFINTLNQDQIAWNFNWIFITWIHSSPQLHMAWRLWKGKIPHVQMCFMYMLAFLWQIFWIWVSIFWCQHICIIYWQLMDQTARFMNIERQHLMSSIVDSINSWMIACQVCSSCHIYLTQVSIFE